MEVRGEKQTFLLSGDILSVSPSFFLYSLSVSEAFPLGSGGGAWCPKVPAKL